MYVELILKTVKVRHSFQSSDSSHNHVNEFKTNALFACAKYSLV